MRRLKLYLAVAVTVVTAAAAGAQSDSDRLRDALRTATAQARALEDQRAALQAKLTAAEQERDRLRKQSDAYKEKHPRAPGELSKAKLVRISRKTYREIVSVGRSAGGQSLDELFG